MDGIANVARQQQSQVKIQGGVQEESQQVQQSSQTRTKQSNVVNSAADNTNKLDSKESVEDLVKQLNDALSPFNTNIKFGVDTNDIFYVAAVDTKTNTIIRRYPAEEAQNFLPKMQEVSGILFDSKG